MALNYNKDSHERLINTVHWNIWLPTQILEILESFQTFKNGLSNVMADPALGRKGDSKKIMREKL